MDDFTASVLVFTVFFPAVAAFVALLTVQRESISQARFLALAATSMTFVASLILVFAFDRSPGVPGDQFQFESQATWIDAATAGFDVQFHMGVDGLGMTMVFLTTFLFVIAVLISFGIELRAKEYFIWILALETGVLGVFTSLDLIMFFLFWEVELLPMYMLISIARSRGPRSTWSRCSRARSPTRCCRCGRSSDSSSSRSL
jgi:NADH-quinone oxidoreductase subunit M